MRKRADLKPDVVLQPHQERLYLEAEKAPVRKLLLHALGSGKSLSSLAMAEARQQPYVAVVPASLRANYESERQKFTTGETPAEVLSYTQLGAGAQPTIDPHTVVYDEAHRLRTPGTQQTQAAQDLARRARQLILLSGTPIVNDPADLAVPLSLLTGKDVSPKEFRKRFIREQEVFPGFLGRLRGISPGTEEDIHDAKQLKALLKGHVDYYAPAKADVPVTHEDVAVEMGTEQARLYEAMWGRLPWYLRWKLQNDFPLSKTELARSISFLTGPRQVGLSPYPYMANKDPLKAYELSPKLQRAHRDLTRHLQDPRRKALVFSNFIDAGLTPYAAALEKAKVPHAIFHGGLSDAQRKQLVEDFNHGRIRVALLGPSGTEGLSFRGVQLVQLLDPYWHSVRPHQAQGRALRFDSHTGLPEDLRDVKVQRYTSRLPLGWMDRMLRRAGLDRSAGQRGVDDYLRTMAERKEKLNQKFFDLLREVGSEKQGAGTDGRAHLAPGGSAYF